MDSQKQIFRIKIDMERFLVFTTQTPITIYNHGAAGP